MSRKDKVNGQKENIIKTNTFQSWQDYDGTRVVLNMIDRGILLDMDIVDFSRFAEQVYLTSMAISKKV